MKQPATRTAAVGLATAAVLSGALALAAPATAQDNAAAGPAQTAKVGDAATTSSQASTSGPASGNVATGTHKAKGKAYYVSAAGATYDWGFRNGTWTLHLNGLPVSAGQAVAVSATEVDAFGREFVGGAHVYCKNVSVTQNRVSTRCHFEWGTPIHVKLHYVY